MISQFQYRNHLNKYEKQFNYLIAVIVTILLSTLACFSGTLIN